MEHKFLPSFKWPSSIDATFVWQAKDHIYITSQLGTRLYSTTKVILFQTSFTNRTSNRKVRQSCQLAVNTES